MTEDEMVGWHHQLNRHEFEQALDLVMDREALVLLLSQVFVCFLKKFINFYLYLLFLSLGVSLCFFPSFIKLEPQVKTFILYDFEHLKFIFNHCFSGTSQICIYWLFLPHLIRRIL